MLPIIGVVTQPIIGGESVLIGSIFDVYSCQKTLKNWYNLIILELSSVFGREDSE